jgi:hypothetical protein
MNLLTRMARPARAASSGIALLSLGAACLANEGVQPFRGQYEGHRKIALFTATARATLELRRSASFILYTMQSTVTWSVLERRFRDCSVIQVDGHRLLPLEYLHVDEASPRFNVHTRFDWATHQASTLLGTAAGAAVTSINWPTWDPMSFQVALIALAPHAAPGQGEAHSVVERGVLKQHHVSFTGAVPLASLGRHVQAHEVVSRKDSGRAALYLLPEDAWRPSRVTIDDVTIDLIGSPVANAPQPLPEGEVPRCAAP